MGWSTLSCSWVLLLFVYSFVLDWRFRVYGIRLWFAAICLRWMVKRIKMMIRKMIIAIRIPIVTMRITRNRINVRIVTEDT